MVLFTVYSKNNTMSSINNIKFIYFLSSVVYDTDKEVSSVGNNLGDFVKKYRVEHDLSLREFGKLADLSHTHIDSIERGIDPRTGKPVKISNETIQKLAKATGANPTHLFELSIDTDDSLGNSVFSRRFKDLRTEKGLTQKEVAERLGVGKSIISMYEKGTRDPGRETLELICDFFNVDYDYMTGKSDVKRRNSYSHLASDPPIKFPAQFTDPVQARQYLSMHTIYGSEGFNNSDIDKMGDEEVLEYANEVLRLMDTLSYKYRK
jgi:transcriptional regulator with XRE-family HTH domain